jgi:hypothetical protein
VRAAGGGEPGRTLRALCNTRSKSMARRLEAPRPSILPSLAQQPLPSIWHPPSAARSPYALGGAHSKPASTTLPRACSVSMYSCASAARSIGSTCGPAAALAAVAGAAAGKMRGLSHQRSGSAARRGDADGDSGASVHRAPRLRRQRRRAHGRPAAAASGAAAHPSDSEQRLARTRSMTTFSLHSFTSPATAAMSAPEGETKSSL